MNRNKKIRPVVYRHFDKLGCLLYVGMSNDVFKRHSVHYTADWYYDVSTITIQHFAEVDDAKYAEILAIYEESPKYNVVHANDPLREDIISKLKSLRGSDNVELEKFMVIVKAIIDLGRVTCTAIGKEKRRSEAAIALAKDIPVEVVKYIRSVL